MHMHATQFLLFTINNFLYEFNFPSYVLVKGVIHVGGQLSTPQRTKKFSSYCCVRCGIDNPKDIGLSMDCLCRL